MTDRHPNAPGTSDRRGWVPPNAIDAECAVISSALLSAEALDDAKTIVSTTEYFYDPRNLLIWKAILEIDESGVNPDVITVAANLRAQGRLEQAGGAAYLAEVVDATPAVGNVAHHASLIEDAWLQRTVLQLSRQHAVEAYAQVNPRAWAVDAGDQIHEVIPPQRTDVGTAIRDVVIRVVESIQARAQGKPNGEAVPTGLATLDEKLCGGLYRQGLYLACGRPGLGKTSLGLGICHHVASAGQAACFLGLEMPPEQVVSRQLSAVSNVPVYRMLGSVLDQSELAAVVTAAGTVGKLPIGIDDCAGQTVGQLRTTLRRRIRKLRAIHGDTLRLGVVAIDYFQIIRAIYKNGRSRDQELGEILTSLRLMAKEFDCPVLLLAQLRREAEKNSGGRPTLADIREAGAGEQDAYGVILMYRDDYYTKEASKEPGVAELDVAKQRNGPTGVVKVAWQKETTSFRNLDATGFDSYEFGPLDYGGSDG